MRLKEKYQVLIIQLATTALAAVEDKIPNVINLVKKTYYDTKINEIENEITNHSHDKYITIPEFHKLTAENFTARLAKAKLITNIDFDDKLENINKKVNSQKHLIQSLFGKSNFEDDGTQNYLILQRTYTYFNTVSNNDSSILSLKSK